MTRPRPLPRSFFAGNALEVAPQLLNKVLEHRGRSIRIVEVEAYLGCDDPASHAYRGPTPRTEVMFGPPGHLYVYLSYGIHWCMNIVCGPNRVAGAVLLRAGAPLTGIDEQWAARPAARRRIDLANGPGKLAAALGIDDRHRGLDLCAAQSPVIVADDGVPPPASPMTGPRIGISTAIDHPWRFFVPADPHVSPARRPR